MAGNLEVEKGFELEMDVFPMVGGDARCRSREEALAKRGKTEEDDWAIIEKNQPWDPTDPGHGFAGDLRTEVCDALKIEYGDKWLKLLSASKSVRDWLYHTDACIEYEEKRITMDITKNPAKLGDNADIEKSADIIIEPEHVQFPARRQELARQIADAFISEERREAEAQQQRTLRPRRPLIRRNRK